MKDEYKVIIGVIIVALIILVGAYELSGTNVPISVSTNGTSDNSTIGKPGTSGSTTTTTEAGAVPTPVSGVKQTEFGYWITYPPLGEQTWSGPAQAPAGGSPGSVGSSSDAFFAAKSGSVTMATMDINKMDPVNNLYAVTVPVKRTATAGALSVSVACSHTSKDYALPASGTVNFAAGSDTSSITVYVPISFISTASKDTITLTLANGAVYTFQVN